MEQPLELEYPWGHETPRNSSTIGRAAPASAAASEKGQESFCCRPLAGSGQEFCVSVVSGLPAAGQEGVAPQADSRTPSPAERIAEEKVKGVVIAEPPGLWLQDRPLDSKANRSPDR